MQGFLLLNKPEGITSYGAVARVKRLSGEKRIGHTGTLDPMAKGVLPLLLGRATALSSYLLDADKGYRATVKLGIETDSGDITGNVTAKREVAVNKEQLLSVLEKFKGKSRQTPPMFSALKKDGVRLYDLARAGKTVDIPEREIEVFKLDLVKELDENFEFTVETVVSKGTYIRSLARDIGRALGCGATLTSLLRTKTAGFDIGDCVTLEELEQDFSARLLPCDRVVEHFRKISVTMAQARRFTNGGQLDLDRIKLENFSDGELIRVYFEENFLGLGFTDTKKHQLAVKCVIYEEKI